MKLPTHTVCGTRLGMSFPALLSRFFLLGCCLVTATTHAESGPKYLHLRNNQPFAIRTPIELRNVSIDDKTPSVSTGEALQQNGSNVVAVLSLATNSEQEIDFSDKTPKVVRLASVTAKGTACEFSFDGKSLGDLAWDIFIEPVHGKSEKEGASTRRDFAKSFAPISLEWKKSASGPVFDSFVGVGLKSGLQLVVTVKCYHTGFLDWSAQVKNVEAKSSSVYAAVICRWNHPDISDRTLCYDNRRSQFPANSFSRFREDEGRFWQIQHGVDWILTHTKNGPDVVWVSPFDPSFTVKADASSKNPARYTGANQAQLGKEAQSTTNALYFVTEIARDNIRSYRDRMKENVLPAKAESVTCSARLCFSKTALTDDDADHAFLAATTYVEQHVENRRIDIDFGVRSVRFGTSYFPYSTFGENFDGQCLPGMDRDAFWPLAADTVNQWQLFADDIRRDLRLAKWMGFDLIRLHHLELLAPIDKKIRSDYLDFLFGELRQLKLKALLDVYASPAQITELLQRYGDVVDSVEVENEILIWGIPVDRPQEWTTFYNTIKKAAPHVRVHWTAQNNTGIFDRMTDLGIPFDRVSLHSYVDSLDALPSARGWALATASYGAKVGKPPVITEWNWRSLTRMTEEDRAKIYPQIIEGAIGTRSIPDFYQFQFNETLAPNPRVGRGNILRHYELLHLSRRPKAEAFQLARLIAKYSGRTDLRRIAVGYGVCTLDHDGGGTARLAIKNLSDIDLDLNLAIETPKGFTVKYDPVQVNPVRSSTEGTLFLHPHQAQTLTLHVGTSVPITSSQWRKAAGFYYPFIRITGQDLVQYAPIEVRVPRVPQLDLTRKTDVQYPRGVEKELALDLSTIDGVVYGKDASVLEVETAIAIAETLESATGKPMPYYEVPTTAPKGDLIVVGTPKTQPLIRLDAKEALLTGLVQQTSSPNYETYLYITGSNAEAVEKAGMDFILRYWVNAKDSAARKVGIVAKELPRGVDPTKLP